MFTTIYSEVFRDAHHEDVGPYKISETHLGLYKISDPEPLNSFSRVPFFTLNINSNAFSIFLNESSVKFRILIIYI